MSRTKEYVNLKCKECGLTFEKEKREYTRQKKNKGNAANFFCTRSCGAKHRNRNLSQETKERMISGLHRYQKESREKELELGYKNYGRFSYYLKKARARSKDKSWANMDLTNSYLEEVWSTVKNSHPFLIRRKNAKTTKLVVRNEFQGK